MTNNKNHTFAMIKSRALSLNWIENALDTLNAHHVIVFRSGVCALKTDKVEALYQDHISKSYFPDLLHSVTSGPVMLLRLTSNISDDVCHTVRGIIGTTNILRAESSTLRGNYYRFLQKSGFPPHPLYLADNGIHCSDSPESAERELQLFFG